MRHDQDRIAVLDRIADRVTTLAGIAAVVLADLHAAQGQPEQERHARPQLHPDLRDLPASEQPDLAGIPHPRAVPAPAIDYADPTGNTGVKHDQASHDLAELDRRLERILGDAEVVTKIFQRHQSARTPAQLEDVRRVRDGELDGGDEWCRSHMQVAVLEPIELRKTGAQAGAPYYTGMCRACGSLLARLKRQAPKRFAGLSLPPRELVQIMTYRKVRESDIDALIGPQHRGETGEAERRPAGEDRQKPTARRAG